MSGLEFRELPLTFSAVTVPFPLLLGVLRRALTCDAQVVGYRESTGIFALGVAGTYIYSLFTQWDDSLHVVWFLFYPIGIAIFVAGQVIAILLGTRVVGLLLPPKEKPLCWEY